VANGVNRRTPFQQAGAGEVSDKQIFRNITYSHWLQLGATKKVGIGNGGIDLPNDENLGDQICMLVLRPCTGLTGGVKARS
jgi:hypothetical protein